jgi:heme A synthase
LADCSRIAQATGWDWQALNPWREPSLGSLAPFNPAGAPAQWAHRIGALVTLPALALVGAAAWRRGRRPVGATVLALVAVQGALGWLMVATGLPIALVLLHNLCAALLLAVLARMV